MSLNLPLRDDVWYVMGTVTSLDGKTKRIRRSTKFRKPERKFASAVMSQILDDALTGRLDSPDSGVEYVSDAIDLYLGRPNPPGEADRYCLNRVRASLGRVPLKDVKITDFMVFFNGRKVKANTLAREMTSVNSMLAYAREMGMDVADVKLKKPMYDDARLRWLEEGERDALIGASAPAIRGLLTFLFYTGARLGEAFELRWSDVIDGKAVLSTRKGKMKKLRRRAIPLVPEVLDAMGERKGTNDLVFGNSHGNKWDRSSFYRYFYDACERSGIEDFKPHDCRHTFASLLVQKGASLRAVADLLGHQSLTMVMRYAHFAPSHLESTVGLLKT